MLPLLPPFPIRLISPLSDLTLLLVSRDIPLLLPLIPLPPVPVRLTFPVPVDSTTALLNIWMPYPEPLPLPVSVISPFAELIAELLLKTIPELLILLPLVPVRVIFPVPVVVKLGKLGVVTEEVIAIPVFTVFFVIFPAIPALPLRSMFPPPALIMPPLRSMPFPLITFPLPTP